MRKYNSSMFQLSKFRLSLIILFYGTFLTQCIHTTAKQTSQEIRYPGKILLPTVFEDVWYRSEDKGFSFVAWESSGTLVVYDTMIVFNANGDTLTFNFFDIQSVGWGKVGNDFYNEWAILNYNKKDSIHIAAFKDGSSLGHGKDTDLIYSTIKYAVEVIGDIDPNPECFYSGWVNLQQSGLIFKDEKPAIAAILTNKTPDSVWITITINPLKKGISCIDMSNLKVDEEKLFFCMQDSVIIDYPYFIKVYIFQDKKRSQLLEKNCTYVIISQEYLENIREAFRDN